jgi:hypothetical protein
MIALEDNPVTFIGTLLCAFDPAPSWPLEFLPQHFTPLA